MVRLSRLLVTKYQEPNQPPCTRTTYGRKRLDCGVCMVCGMWHLPSSGTTWDMSSNFRISRVSQSWRTINKSNIIAYQPKENNESMCTTIPDHVSVSSRSLESSGNNCVLANASEGIGGRQPKLSPRTSGESGGLRVQGLSSSRRWSQATESCQNGT